MERIQNSIEPKTNKPRVNNGKGLNDIDISNGLPLVRKRLTLDSIVRAGYT